MFMLRFISTSDVPPFPHDSQLTSSNISSCILAHKTVRTDSQTWLPFHKAMLVSGDLDGSTHELLVSHIPHPTSDVRHRTIHISQLHVNLVYGVPNDITRLQGTHIQKGTKWQELPPCHCYTIFIGMLHAVDHRHMIKSTQIKASVTAQFLLSHVPYALSRLPTSFPLPTASKRMMLYCNATALMQDAQSLTCRRPLCTSAYGTVSRADSNCTPL